MCNDASNVPVTVAHSNILSGTYWLDWTAISVKPVTLTLVPISSLSDDNKYILSSEVLMGTNLRWLCAPGIVLAHCRLYVSLRTYPLISFCVQKNVIPLIFSLAHLYRSSGVKMWFLSAA
jgi:hypothetical protein